MKPHSVIFCIVALLCVLQQAYGNVFPPAQLHQAVGYRYPSGDLRQQIGGRLLTGDLRQAAIGSRFAPQLWQQRIGLRQCEQCVCECPCVDLMTGHISDPRFNHNCWCPKCDIDCADEMPSCKYPKPKVGVMSEVEIIDVTVERLYQIPLPTQYRQRITILPLPQPTTSPVSVEFINLAENQIEVPTVMTEHEHVTVPMQNHHTYVEADHAYIPAQHYAQLPTLYPQRQLTYSHAGLYPSYPHPQPHTLPLPRPYIRPHPITLPQPHPLPQQHQLSWASHGSLPTPIPNPLPWAKPHSPTNLTWPPKSITAPPPPNPKW